MVAMNILVLAALAAGTAVGVLVIVAGLTGRQLRAPARSKHSRALLARLALVCIAGVFVVAVTGWLVGAVLAAAACWVLPGILGGKAQREAAIARTEAIASLTEMIRDSIVAASGLEEAIVASAPVAPPAIAPQVRSLVRRLDHEHLPESLVAFGHDLNHPSGDLVVAALVIAARMEASDLSGLLSRLADATRGEARMRIRVEVGRARVRTATKVIVGVVVIAVVFLAIANAEYLAVYDSSGGQAMLAVIGSVFALGGWLLSRLATIDLPERFTARAVNPVAEP
jgi:tight adherence protein B